MIDHGNGVVCWHMSSIGVSYGQYVTAGQYVGAISSTGVSTGLTTTLRSVSTAHRPIRRRTFPDFPIGTADFPHGIKGAYET